MRKESFKNWQGGTQQAETFKEQVQKYKQQIREVERYTRFVLHPGKRSSFLNKWDLVTAAALLYTMLITPFEGMRAEAQTPGFAMLHRSDPA